MKCVIVLTNKNFPDTDKVIVLHNPYTSKCLTRCMYVAYIIYICFSCAYDLVMPPSVSLADTYIPVLSFAISMTLKRKIDHSTALGQT